MMDQVSAIQGAPHTMSAASLEAGAVDRRGERRCKQQRPPSPVLLVFFLPEPSTDPQPQPQVSIPGLYSARPGFWTVMRHNEDQSCGRWHLTLMLSLS